MATADKLVYLDETKDLLREAINYSGGELGTDDAFRTYVEALYSITGVYPKSLFIEPDVRGAWLNFNDPAALSQSSSESLPPGSGDAIERAYDLGTPEGNGGLSCDFIADGAPPTLLVDEAGFLCADFSGGAWMRSFSSAPLGFEPRVDEIYLCVVAKQLSDVTGWLLSRTNSASVSDASYGLLFTALSTGLGMRGVARSTNNSGLNVPTIGEWHIYELLVETTNPGLLLAVDAQTLIPAGGVGTGVSGAPSTYLAARATGTTPAPVRIAEVIIRDKLPTALQRQRLLDHYTQKYSIAQDDPTSPNTVEQGDFRYASSIDPGITDLFAKWSYDNSLSVAGGLPVVVIMHGYGLEAASISSALMADWASYGFFTLAVGMRGRDGASGSPDSGGRELYDIIDAVEKVKNDFPAIINSDRIHVAGYSGGGGNVFGLACRFPDYFTVSAAHFGMSDYGYSETQSWGAESSGSRKTQIADWVGARPYASWPTTNPVNLNKFRSRNTLEAIGVNVQGGHLFIYHDEDDTNVRPAQSQRVADAFVAESNARYSLSITTSSDDPRWIHGLPNPGSEVAESRSEWGAAVNSETYAAWSAPSTGSFRILGWLRTKLFEVWLGDGTEHVADLTYNYATGEYTVTPLTGGVEVSVVDIDGLTASGTISAATTLTVS